MSEEIRAFPNSVSDRDIEVQDGMTLRDYFAGQALAGLCARPAVMIDYGQYAEIAYRQASAMIARREKDNE